MHTDGYLSSVNLQIEQRPHLSPFVIDTTSRYMYTTQRIAAALQRQTMRTLHMRFGGAYARISVTDKDNTSHSHSINDSWTSYLQPVMDVYEQSGTLAMIDIN